MKTKFTFFLLVILLNLFTVSSSTANHIAGGEITYSWTGGSSYHAVFTIYRDCVGATMPPTLSVNLTSIAFAQNITLTAIQIPGTGQVISHCGNSFTTCNGGTFLGIQKWQYYVDCALPMRSMDWKFSLTMGSRDIAITTLSNAATDGLYAEATLNDSLLDHDSPVFTADPYLFCCNGTPASINCSTINNCDSVSYSLVKPRYNLTTYVPYILPYDSLHFVSSSTTPSLDPFTGILSFTPTFTEVPVYVVLVKQYHNGILVGTIMRDILLFTSPCTLSPNHLPQISGINGTSQNTIIFPANKTSCFNLFSSDSDSVQTTRLSFAAPFTGATFIVDNSANQGAVFCWKPLISDTGSCPHCFAVTVYDNYCPDAANSSIYCITVVDSGYLLNSNEMISKFTVVVWPNPFSKSATVTISPAFTLLRWQFTLFDALGRTVMNKWNERNLMTIDASAFSAGVYFYSIRNDNQTLSNGKILITQ